MSVKTYLFKSSVVVWNIVVWCGGNIIESAELGHVFYYSIITSNGHYQTLTTVIKLSVVKHTEIDSGFYLLNYHKIFSMGLKGSVADRKQGRNVFAYQMMTGNQLSSINLF